ncbi:hypothetical protein MBLNU457_6147t1 [Dothideomycetes sp. NU457]
MAQQAQDTKSLEDELRNMILGNVQINQPQRYDNSGRGRGRGRGNFGPQQHSFQQNGHPGRGNFQDDRSFRGGLSGGRGNRGALRGGYQSAVPADRQEGFNQFMNQRARGTFSHQQYPNTQPGGQVHPPQTHYQQRPPRQSYNNAPQQPLDAHSFKRGPPQYTQNARYGQPQIWQAGPPNYNGLPNRPLVDSRMQYLEQLAEKEIPEVEMTKEEYQEKEQFRTTIQTVFQDVLKQLPTTEIPQVSLESFGSFRSGFATKGSDMDLVIVSQSTSTYDGLLSLDEKGLPRLLEQELLNRGYGARLLSWTRVPIIKICETPTPELQTALKEARAKWDALPEEEKLGNARPSDEPKKPTAESQTSNGETGVDGQTKGDIAIEAVAAGKEDTSETQTEAHQPANGGTEGESDAVSGAGSETVAQADSSTATPGDNRSQPEKPVEKKDDNTNKQWRREKAKGPLDFPKDGVGIQCDINFFNPLGLHNTEMLRCYSLCDPRVRPMVLFVKAWAKQRRINHPYSGTLSSYGYVLMVLHYLVNVARPPVLPNLQLHAQRAGAEGITIDEWVVNYWNDEAAMTEAAKTGRLTNNREPLGTLLKGFYQYYASTANGFGFIWMKDVLSLRTPGGIRSKEEKGWTGAKTETTDTKEVRHRYLFAIEDPFELAHNVARTVTHKGIVAIRDEFRRAWRILGAVGHGNEPQDGHLFDALVEHPPAEDEEATARAVQKLDRLVKEAV